MEDYLSPRFTSLYANLLIADAARAVIGREASSSLSDQDIAYLLGTATRFALKSSINSSADAKECHYAYEIAVRAPSFVSKDPRNFACMSELILSRLGNFPARRLLRENYNFDGSLTDDPFMAVESMVRESENRFGSEIGDPLLTDFQVRLLGSLDSRQYVSVSAPTSAGKSFTLGLELLRRLKGSEHFTAVFIVPTRALIRQVSLDLIELMREHALVVSVISAPSVADEGEDGVGRTIFVLTQERLATLLASAPSAFSIDAFLIDEAQEIGKNERGQTLERVLRLALARHAKASVFFSSPLRSNPEYLIDLFSVRGDTSDDFIEYQAPVLKI
jgi:DEAD/DEAH box helicase